MWQKEVGILLSVTKHNDKSCIIHTFSSEQGYASYMFYLAKSSKGSEKNAILQPLTRIEYESKGGQQGKSLQHLSQIRNRAPYKNIPFHPVKRAIALYLSEFLTYALKNEESNIPLYMAIEESLEWFDNAVRYSNFHLLVMILTARHLGIMPACDSYTQGYFFDMNEGEYVSQMPHHTEYLDRDLSYKLALLSATNLQTMHNTPLTHQERVTLLRKLNSYFKIHLPLFPKLKSIDILEEIFEDN